MSDLYIGLMSGTSLDGVDGVLADFSGGSCQVLAHVAVGFSDDLRSELLALNTAGHNELHRAALAGNALVRVYAAVVHQLLTQAPRRALPEQPQVRAIGAHGQTVRHRPGQFDGVGYTLQLNQPALLAELTGLDVVADFRSRDVAAGGQGAPLAPFFHAAMFAPTDAPVGVLNIGGISNLSLLRPHGDMLGFDCGPGNALLDAWCFKHQGMHYDDGGAWAATGQVIAPLLQSMLNEPYFQQAPPKSTGRDLFNTTWLADKLLGYEQHNPADIQATLTELTALGCSTDVLRHAPELRRLIVCGGGALNTQLMKRIQALLPDASVTSSAAHGLPPLQVEAAAFAWLARKTILREALPLQSTTGARGARVLGSVYPA